MSGPGWRGGRVARTQPSGRVAESGREAYNIRFVYARAHAEISCTNAVVFDKCEDLCSLRLHPPKD